MEYKLMKKWVKALRSGKYKQGTRGNLFNEETEEYCCLGVLCKIENIRTGRHGYLTNHMQKKLKFKTPDGKLNRTYKSLKGLAYTLTELNDEGVSFKKIANIIEKKL